MDGWLLRDQSIQGRSQVQFVEHAVDRTVADEVRTSGWESDGSDGIAVQKAEITTDQPQGHQVTAEGFDAALPSHSGGQRDGHPVRAFGEVDQ